MLPEPFFAAEIDNNALMGVVTLGVLSMIGGLIAIHTKLKGYIREAAGVKEDPPERAIAGQPIRVMEERRMATWQELTELRERVEKLDGDIEGLRAQMTETKDTLVAEGSRRAASIHGRVDAVNSTVARLDERTQTTNAQLAEQGRKIDLLLQRSNR